MRKFCFLDVESTGLGDDAEVLEIAIVDGYGEVLVNTLVQPVRHKNWTDAQAIHGISPEDVFSDDVPTFEKLKPTLSKVLKNSEVVIYNAAFDSKYLGDVLYGLPVHCCMKRFAEHYGAWDDVRGCYKWQKLIFAAQECGHIWESDAHRALADAQACRSVWQYLNGRLLAGFGAEMFSVAG